MRKWGRLGVGVSINFWKTVNEWATIYLVKVQEITLVDTQGIRAKLLRQLEGLFELAICIALGNVRHLCPEDRKECVIPLKQREKWARITAYTAKQIVADESGFFKGVSLFFRDVLGSHVGYNKKKPIFVMMLFVSWRASR